MPISNWRDCNVNNSFVISSFLLPYYARTPYENYLLLNIQPTIATIGAVLNTIFILVVVLDKQMHTLTNIYLVSLALSDLLFLVFYSIVTYIGAVISPFYYNWQFLGPAACLIINTIYYGTYYFSLFIVTFICFERYLAVCYPLTHRKIASKSRTKKLVMGCGTLAFCMTCVMLLYTGYSRITCNSFPSDYKGFGGVNLRRTFCLRFAIVQTYNAREITSSLQVFPFLMCLIGMS